MTEDRVDETGTTGEPGVADVVEKRPKVSIVWIFPLVAAVLGGWLLYRTFADAGIPIRITFDNASGLEAGKTAIKFKDVQVGLVDTIEVAPDMAHVVLTANLDQNAERYLRKETRFWVVRPRITTAGISGLGTLLSGAYVTLEPGSGGAARDFVGLENPPPVNVDARGHKFVLKSATIGSIGIGSPVSFRGLRVGEVISYELDAKADKVSIEIFVDAPHHTLVWKETQFWNASGIDVSLGADGMNIQTASLESLLIGGIAFETPLQSTEGTPAENGNEFTLHPRRQDIEPRFVKVWKYVAYFQDSVRGLSEGAPVELSGLKMGEVVGIGFEYDPDTQLVRIPVTIQLEPERLLARGGEVDHAANSELQANENARQMIAAGLRAQLKTGSLLTGQLYIDLVMMPGSPLHYVRGGSPYFELPTLPSSGLSQIEESVTEILAKVKALPIDELVTNASQAAASLNRLLSSPGLEEAVRNGNLTLEEFRKLAVDIDAQLNRLVTSVEGMISPSSPLGVELVGALGELGRAARSIRVLTSYLERHPEALLQGKPGGK